MILCEQERNATVHMERPPNVNIQEFPLQKQIGSITVFVHIMPTTMEIGMQGCFLLGQWKWYLLWCHWGFFLHVLQVWCWIVEVFFSMFYSNFKCAIKSCLCFTQFFCLLNDLFYTFIFLINNSYHVNLCNQLCSSGWMAGRSYFVTKIVNVGHCLQTC